MRTCFIAVASVGSLLIGLAREAHAQTRFSREGADDRYVVLRHGDLLVKFDTWFGGAPLIWKHRGQQIISSRPGEGFQNTIEMGQDLTQATANEETVLRIARQSDSAADIAYRNYYLRESLPTDWPRKANYYKVVGFYPDFWLSHEAADDALPPLSNGSGQDGWVLRHLNGGDLPKPFSQLSFPDRGGAPVFFRPTNRQTAGILMEANEIRPVELPWNRRLREIQNGRVAFRCRISFSEASPDAWAGVVFRRSVPAGLGANMDHAYQSPGYSLNINKQGVIQVLRSDGRLAWSGGINPTVLQTASTVQGCLIELRTHNADPSYMEVWVQRRRVAVFNDPYRPIYTGPHFGLIAYTAPSATKTNYVKFSDREVFDVGTEVEATYTPRPDGSLETDLIVRNAGFVPNSEPRRLYRVNTVSFLEPGKGLDTVWTERRPGVIRDPATKKGSYARSILKAPDPVYAFWAGRADRTLGLYCVPLEVALSGTNLSARGEHGFVDAEGNPPNVLRKTICHLNALPQRPNGRDTGPPWTATRVRLRAKWWPVHP